MTSTPPKQDAFSAGIASTAGAAGTTTQGADVGPSSALQYADQLVTFATDLKRELKAYGDPNVVGRDTASLQTYFQQIHNCEMQIAQFMGINWTPTVWQPGQT